jgi:N-methylhydantoinase B
VPFNSTFATTMYPFKCALAPDIPNSEALFRPIGVTAPPGSILNATFPAPVKARAKTTNNLYQVLFGALWPIFGEHAQASNGGIWPLVHKGTRDEGTPFLVDMLPYGGRGALPNADGMPPIAFPTNSRITPCEVLETQAPIRFHQKALRPDTGGLGRNRGGLGQVITFEHVGREPMTFSLTPDRITTRPHGLAGGQDAEPGEVLINGTPTYRFPAIQLVSGDTVELRLPGGGGFGPARDRQRDRLQHDRRHGYTTGPSRRNQGVSDDSDRMAEGP